MRGGRKNNRILFIKIKVYKCFIFHLIFIQNVSVENDNRIGSLRSPRWGTTFPQTPPSWGTTFPKTPPSWGTTFPKTPPLHFGGYGGLGERSSSIYGGLGGTEFLHIWGFGVAIKEFRVVFFPY